MAKEKKEGIKRNKQEIYGKSHSCEKGATESGGERPFRIVGIGASAGGLEALEQLFTRRGDDELP